VESLLEQTLVKHDFRSPEGFQSWVLMVATRNQESEKNFVVDNPKRRLGKPKTKRTDRYDTKMKYKMEEFLLFLNNPMIYLRLCI
jgi:hypothetical protein